MSDVHYRLHNSDRILFKRCRRKWNWESRLRENLILIDGIVNPNLWLGSGFHFALEDYHGYRHFDTPGDALEAYSKAHRSIERPENYEDLILLGQGMLGYYTELWLPKHNSYTDARKLETLWIDGIPQVEVNYEVQIPNLYIDGLPVYAGGTFDRIAKDQFDTLWIIDYKTAATIDVAKLVTDPQVSQYYWAGTYLYGMVGRIEGIAYQQHRKKVPDFPRKLKDGSLSLDKSQVTTFALYRDALYSEYGGVPQRYQEFLAMLSDKETEDGDDFVRLDFVERNPYQVQSEEGKLIEEAYDMLNPNLPLYPNPTRDCYWDCSFRSPCLALDDGSDYKYMLDSMYIKKEERDSWRQRLQYPQQAQRLLSDNQVITQLSPNLNGNQIPQDLSPFAQREVNSDI